MAVIGPFWRAQVWAQWEEDGSWLDGLLTDTETSIPKMHLEQNSEEELSNRLSVYQVIHFLLQIKLCLYSNSEWITKETIRQEQYNYLHYFRVTNLNQRQTFARWNL